MRIKQLLFTGFIGVSLLLSACATDDEGPISPSDISSEPSSSEVISENSSSDSQNSSSSSSSSSHDTLILLDVTKLKTNINKMTNYSLESKSSYYYTDTNQSIDMLSESIMKANVDGKDYSYSTTFKESYTSTIEKFIELYNPSYTAQEIRENGINYGGVKYDADSDLLVGANESENGPYFIYHSKESTQPIKYVLNGNEVVSGFYITKEDLQVFDAYKNFFLEIVNNGKPVANSENITYTFTKEYKASEDYKKLFGNIGDFDTATLQIKNYYPYKLTMRKVSSVDNYPPFKKLTASTEFKFSNIGGVSLPTPITITPCAHHSTSSYSDETGHGTYCRDCGLITSPITPHQYDEEHGVCFECGAIEGLSNDYYYSRENEVFGDKLRGNYYTYRANKTGKGELINIYPFIQESKYGYSWSSFSSYHNVYYVTEAGAAAVTTNETTISPSGSCYKLKTTTYKFYTNLDIDTTGSYPKVNNLPLDEYINTINPTKVVPTISLEGHNSYSIKKTQIDDCHFEEKTVCDHEKVNYSTIEHINEFSRFEPISYDEMVREFSPQIVTTNNVVTLDKSASYYRAYCEKCNHDLYLFSNDSFKSTHPYTETYCHIVEKVGNVVRYQSVDMTLPHYYDDNDHCIFCERHLSEANGHYMVINGYNPIYMEEITDLPDGMIKGYKVESHYLSQGSSISLYEDGEIIYAHSDLENYDYYSSNYEEINYGYSYETFTVRYSCTCDAYLYVNKDNEYIFSLVPAEYNGGASGGGSSSSEHSYSEPGSIEYCSDEPDEESDVYYITIGQDKYELDQTSTENGREATYCYGYIELTSGQTVRAFHNDSQIPLKVETRENGTVLPNYNQRPENYNSTYYVTIANSTYYGEVYLNLNYDGSYSIWIEPNIEVNYPVSSYQYIIYNPVEKYIVAGLSATGTVDYQGRDQYKASGITLYEGDVIQLYDTNEHTGWTPAIDTYSFGNNVSQYLTINGNGTWTVNETMTVDIYAKFKYNDDQIYFEICS